MEIQVAHPEANIFPVVAAARAAQQVEPLAELALTQISLEQRSCTAVVALDQAEIQVALLLAVEATAVHQLQIEAAVVHNLLQAVDWQVQVLRVS
jgi:hypothetical protein